MHRLKKAIKTAIKRTFIDPIKRILLGDIDDMLRDCQHIKEYFEWLELDKPAPPPALVKQITVKEYAIHYGLNVFIETGTYLGGMVYAVRNIFDRIYSIELDDKLYERAEMRFAKYNHISILHGDSSDMMPRILVHIKEPCLFWLDAHYSAGITAKGKLITPILQELHHIFDHPAKEHVILIDDARDFEGKNDYPTKQEIRSLVLSEKPDYVFEVKNDIIRIHKGNN